MQPELPADRIRQAVVMLSAPRALLVSRETPPERPKASFWALAYSKPIRYAQDCHRPPSKPRYGSATFLPN